MVEELPTWFAVPAIVVLSVVAVYRLWIAPSSKMRDDRDEQEL